MPRSCSTLRIAAAMMLVLAFEYSQWVPGGLNGLSACHESRDVTDAEQHVHDVRARGVLILIEAKTAAHVEKMVKCDPRPGISVVAR